jgi:tRNA(fMet)-specific endonuclease VapC
MTTSCLLDADAVIDLINRIPTTVELVQKILSEGVNICVCDVVLTEVFAGLPQGQRQAAINALKEMPYLWTTPEAARQAGEWRYEYRRQGITLTTADMLIAATAVAHGAGLLTGNQRHYPIPELELIPLPRNNT